MEPSNTEVMEASAEEVKGEDTVDAQGWRGKMMMRFSSTPVLKLNVDKNALYYNMDNKRRGIAVVFNHEQFTIPNMENRKGAKADRANIKRCLEGLDFEVIIHDNFTVQEIFCALDKVAALDHSQYDCFLMCVLTHGNTDVLYAKDTGYNPENLWAPFTADNCKSLAGKPKLFFFQACRGSKADPGMRVQADSSRTYKIPVHADFLLAYSTFPGHYSFRNLKNGSWFIQALCDVLESRAYQTDLLTLLTFVNRAVAVDYVSNIPGDPGLDQKKQVPYIAYTLTRLVQFLPKKRLTEL